jgi:hypothetical protein
MSGFRDGLAAPLAVLTVDDHRDAHGNRREDAAQERSEGIQLGPAQG